MVAPPNMQAKAMAQSSRVQPTALHDGLSKKNHNFLRQIQATI